MMLKKRTKSIIIWTVLLVITAIIAMCAFLFAYVDENRSIQTDVVIQSSNNTSSEDNQSQLEPESAPKLTTLKLLGVGDNLIHAAIYSQANKRAGGNGYDFSNSYELVADTIAEADIASINQETVMASIYEPSSYPMFNSPTQLGDEMLSIGFDVFNIANNHCVDKGEKGMKSFFEYWDTRPNATVTGVYRNVDDYNNIRVVERKGMLVSYVGMTQFTNGLSFPENSEIVLVKASQTERIKERIEKAKSISDIVVVNVHWGQEYTNTPTSFQKALAKNMVDWGADVILGHHPHVIQPIEYIERKDGTKGIVCYSLGNFISAQSEAPRMIGGMLDIEFDVTDELKPAISKVSFIPIVTHYGSNFSDVKIIPYSEYNKTLASLHGIRDKSPEFSYQYINEYIKNVINEEFLKTNV